MYIKKLFSGVSSQDITYCFLKLLRFDIYMSSLFFGKSSKLCQIIMFQNSSLYVNVLNLSHLRNIMGDGGGGEGIYTPVRMYVRLYVRHGISSRGQPFGLKFGRLMHLYLKQALLLFHKQTRFFHTNSPIWSYLSRRYIKQGSFRYGICFYFLTKSYQEGLQLSYLLAIHLIRNMFIRNLDPTI